VGPRKFITAAVMLKLVSRIDEESTAVSLSRTGQRDSSINVQKMRLGRKDTMKLCQKYVQPGEPSGTHAPSTKVLSFVVARRWHVRDRALASTE